MRAISFQRASLGRDTPVPRALRRRPGTRAARLAHPMRAIAARRIVLSEDPLGGPGEDDVVRAQAAGGPDDVATYCCSCGFVFCASVSTTVACPHCGADQAW